VRIGDLTDRDLEAAAGIHRAGFPDDPITRLGPEAVARYYVWLLEGPHQSEGIAAFLDDELVGVLVGGSFGSLLPGYLRRNLPFIATRVVLRPRLLLDLDVPARLGRAMSRILFRRSVSDDDLDTSAEFPPTPLDDPAWELLSIAVSPRARGHGVGAALVAEGARRAQRSGYRRMELSVHRENARAIRFYEGIGWRKLVPDGSEWAGRMWRAVSEEDA
jgi:ribosomal protein S18 acetylase RimI-like enzyme